MSQEASVAVDHYIETAAPEARDILREIRRLARAEVPAAVETISYRMPALRMGRVFFYFAAFKHHIGIYPPVHGDAKLQKDLKPYQNEKGNLRFPLDQPMPYPLIRRVVAALAKEYGKPV